MNFEQHVTNQYDLLNETEREVMQYIFQNKERVSDMGIIELGEAVLVSKSSILRLCKKLGYRGYTEMKYSLKESLDRTPKESINLVESLQNDIQKTFDYAEQVHFDEILKHIRKAKTVILYATGYTQNNFMKEFSNDLFLSKRSNYLVSGETNFGMIVDTLSADDFVIVASLSGNTAGIQDTIKKLQIQGVPILAVTSFGDNFLRKHSTYQLFYEISQLPSDTVIESYSMGALYIILTILSRKYQSMYGKWMDD